MILSRRDTLCAAASESYLEQVRCGAQPEGARSRGGNGFDRIRVERLGGFGGESIEQVLDTQARRDATGVGGNMQVSQAGRIQHDVPVGVCLGNLFPYRSRAAATATAWALNRLAACLAPILLIAVSGEQRDRVDWVGLYCAHLRQSARLMR
jgi:hypothetical protein